MDILQIIREKLSILPEGDQSLGIKAVMTHIEIAERYLMRAQKEKDENLFTDVIYRTNHAFEGILKEAYTILAASDASRRTPNEIEQYLTDNDVFRLRVLDLFKNYRSEWRNPSTHDHKLFFTEQEAFLAIVSVSAFVSILLDQIIETTNFRLERERTEGHANTIRNSIGNYNSLPLIYRLRDLFIAFTQDLISQGPDVSTLTEYQIAGLLRGFIAAVDPTLVVVQEALISKDSRLRADLAVVSQSEQVIIELKRLSTRKHFRSIQDQLLTYLVKGGLENGIVYFMPQDQNPVVANETTYNVGDKTLRIVTISSQPAPP